MGRGFALWLALIVGLVLGSSALERREVRSDRGTVIDDGGDGEAHATEDGTGYPPPKP